MSETVLTETQRARFDRNGFLVVRDAVPESVLTETRSVVERTVPEDLTDTDELLAGPEDRHYWNDLDDMTLFGTLNDHLYGYAEALVGSGQLAHPGEFTQVAVRYPTGESPTAPTHATTPRDGHAHVDVVHESGTLQPFTVGATTYLDDVAPRAGGLTVWPGTHVRVAEYLADHDVETLADDVGPVLTDSTVPFEITGPAGTVVLWHSLLVHTGGQHLGRRPRIASFARFERDDEAETPLTAARHPFEHWPAIDR